MAQGSDSGTVALPADIATMHVTAAQGRFGVDFLQLLCTHAGVDCTEPRSGGDVRAIDATIGFEHGDVHVQVKCTTKPFSEKQRTIRWPIEESWTNSWTKLNVRSPIYFVIVRVAEQSDWVRYNAGDTLVGASAYWALIEPTKLGKSIVVRESQQLTLETLRTWAWERQAATSGRAA